MLSTSYALPRGPRQAIPGRGELLMSSSPDITSVTPREAKRLVDEEGYTYVDVRSVPEFEQGHPAGDLEGVVGD